MALAAWHTTITDLKGNVIPNARVEVRDEETGALAVLFKDRNGTVGLGNPFNADGEGLAVFFCIGGAYRVTATGNGGIREWRYVGVGTAQETDIDELLAIVADDIFDDKSAVMATEIQDSVNAIRLNGQASVGDGGGGLYVDFDNGSTDTVISADGRTWYRVRDVGENRIQYEGNLIPKSLIDYGAKIGDVIDTAFESAMSSGHKIFFLPEGEYLVDSSLYIPENVFVFGVKGKSILKVIGRDTHGRNSVLFNKLNGTNISITAVVVMAGSRSKFSSIAINGNARENYEVVAGNKVWWGTPSAIPGAQLGYAGVRLGIDERNVSGYPIYSDIEVSHVDITYCARGGIIVFGEDQRKNAAGAFVGVPFGVVNSTISNCTVRYSHSNIYSIIGGQGITYEDCYVENALHSGLKVYRNWLDCRFVRCTVEYNESTLLSWRDGETPIYFMETERSARTEQISIGHDTASGIAHGVIFDECVVDGKNCAMHRGVIAYSPSSGAVLRNCNITGINRVFVGVVKDIKFEGCLVESGNYTSREYNAGNVTQGYCLHLVSGDSNPISFDNSIIELSGNTMRAFEGFDLSNIIRGNQSSEWNTKNASRFVLVNGNTFELDRVTLPVIASNIPATGGGFQFKGNMYLKSKGNIISKTGVIDTGTLSSTQVVVSDLS